MTAIADALRNLITAVEFTPLGVGPLQHLGIARAALAAHDAAVSAGGWEAFPFASAPSRFAITHGHDVRARAYGANTAARIVACVNACEGIADPGAFIEAANAAETELRFLGGTREAMADALSAARGDA